MLLKACEVFVLKPIKILSIVAVFCSIFIIANRFKRENLLLSSVLSYSDYVNTRSVLLVRDLKNIDEFLNLSPFIIDKNAFGELLKKYECGKSFIDLSFQKLLKHKELQFLKYGFLSGHLD